MAELWFFLVAWLFAVYVALDGFDFGVGILHLYVARKHDERAQALRSIGPVWDGNEVWLVAAGASLLCTFPALFAATFSGFYLPFILVLWLLLFRALGIELRHQLHSPLWHDLWDVAFSLASALLALCFGAALGNLIRGVPLDEEGSFFVPLWTNFGVDGPLGVLDWYTVLVGLYAVLATALNGGLWLAARTDGAVQERAISLIPKLFVLSLGLLACVTAATFVVQPRVVLRLVGTPFGVLISATGLVSFGAAYACARKRRYPLSFWFASAAVTVLVMGAAYGLYPYALQPRSGAGAPSLQSLAASPDTLAGTLYWWVPGMLLAVVYSIIVYSKMPRVFHVEDGPQH